MQNYIHLMQKDSYEAWTHGGKVMRRRFLFFINGVPIREMCEGHQDVEWRTGKDFDEYLGKFARLFERALGCRCVRGRLKVSDALERKP